VALAGDTVAVAGGVYPMTVPAAGSTTVFPQSKGGPVTFVCQGAADVRFASRSFTFYPGVAGIVMRGGCFHFHVVNFGYGGYPGQTHDVTLDGVHMDSFEVAGASNIAITNSEIGPNVDCYAPGATGTGFNGGPISSSAWCDPSDPVQAFWATQPDGSSKEQMEPYIHNGAAGTPTNIVLSGDHFHGMQTKDSFNLHTGGLFIWNSVGVVLRGNTFDHNAVYDVYTSGTQTNLVLENNVFGWPVYPLESSQPTPGGETSKDWREVDFSETTNGALIRFNSFAHGLNPQGSLTNVRVIGNVLGNWTNCATGATFDANVVVGGSCGSRSVTVAPWPYGSYAGVDLRLTPGSLAIDAVPDLGPDYEISGDFTGAPRPLGRARDAGAYESG